MFDRLADTAAPGSDLARRAKDLNARLLLRAGADDTLVTIEHGVVTNVRKGPLLMPSYDFAIEARVDEWSAFLQPVPNPGHHDLMALIRRGEMRFSGDLHPLMANLLYFKLLLASLRPASEAAA